MSNEIFSLLVGCALIGCGPECTVGATEACACIGGLTGVQTCGSEGAFGPCDCGQLSEDDAARLVRSQREYTDGVECQVQVTELAHERYGLTTSGGCLDSLVRAGVARRLGCVRNYGSAYCPEEEIEPAGRARVEGIYLAVPCGEASLVSITHIATDGAEASFTYERDVTLNQSVVDSLSPCRLRVAEAGRARRDRRARRGDTGEWALIARR